MPDDVSEKLCILLDSQVELSDVPSLNLLGADLVIQLSHLHLI